MGLCSKPDGRPFFHVGQSPKVVISVSIWVFSVNSSPMRIDKTNPYSQLTLTPNQAFFLECWFNLGHEESTDAERVSVLNPMIGLQELLDLYGFGSNFGGDQKRLDVALELRGILERNFMLTKLSYKGLAGRLISQFSDANNNSKHEKPARAINKNRVLISSLANQLLACLEQHYIQDTFDELSLAIGQPPAADWQAQSALFQKIRQLSEDLASSLIWRGAGLWELFSYYRNILVKDLNAGQDFDAVFATFRSKAVLTSNEYSVKFTLRNEALVAAINREGGSINFDHFTLQSQNAKDMSAETVLTAMSASIAGSQAFDVLGKVVDALSYTLGREHIVVQKHYLVRDAITGVEKQFELRKLVPNPVYEFPPEKFSRLIGSLGATVGVEGHRDNKILAAFRLYRIGASTENLEAKFVTYWSALESISRDAGYAGAHDDEKVAGAVAPCMVVDYVNKRLTSFIKALRHTNISVLALDDGQQLDLTTLTNTSFFGYLQKAADSDKFIFALEDYPYFKYQLSRFSELCQDPAKLLKVLNRHHEKVKLQVKRIYRARNLITHTGGKVGSLEFLCAHLEHYLKTCVNSIVDVMFEIPTVKTPEEALVRYAFYLENIKSGLKESTDGMEQLNHLIQLHQ